MATGSIKHIEDTGWVSLLSYLNTDNFTARSGYEPYIRVRDHVIYFKGQVYISTAGSGTMTVFSGIPSAYRPSVQIGASVVTNTERRIGYLFMNTGGTITVNLSSYGTQSTYSGIDLVLLSGKGFHDI